MRAERFYLRGSLRLAGALFIFAIAMPSLSQIGVADPPDDDWLKRSRAVLESVDGVVPPEWLRTEPGQREKDIAAEIADAPIGVAQGAQSLASLGADSLLIFGSLALPRETLRALLDQAADAGVVFVLRGVPPGTSIPHVIRQLRDVIGSGRPANVIIDPSLFRRYSIEQVPSFVLQRPGSAGVVTVEGAVTTSWVRRMAARAGPEGANLGHRAESYPIGEPDLVTELQRRMATIDWDAQRRAALNGFWARYDQFVTLPDAKERKEFQIDPTVEVTEDVREPNGETLVKAGELVNPLSMAPLTKTIIVFRGTDSKQVNTAGGLARAAQAHGHGVILLTTEIDRVNGWEDLSRLEQELSAPVYLLTRSLADRFRLQHVPSVIVGRGKNLDVTEVPVEWPQ
jgi:conjugal transfer pilus assembly protein TraW